MQAPSEEELHRDMMEWWDKLQENKRPVEPPRIQVEMQSIKIDPSGEERAESVAVTPPDQIIQ